ncbi:MAG: hypothetical protein ABI548_04770 [Polyangiaceae bacterium]
MNSELRERAGQFAKTYVLGPLFLAAMVGIGSCAPAATLPGTALGTYSVVGTLGTNTCGSGIGADNPWDVTVQLSQDDGPTLYLAQSDGSNEVTGAASAAVSASATTTGSLTSVVTANVDGSDAGAEGHCDLTLATTFTLSLAAGSPPPSFKGTAVYVYSAATVASNSDCTDQLSSSGGKYSTLPCTVNYSLSAKRQ